MLTPARSQVHTPLALLAGRGTSLRLRLALLVVPLVADAHCESFDSSVRHVEVSQLSARVPRSSDLPNWRRQRGRTVAQVVQVPVDAVSSEPPNSMQDEPRGARDDRPTRTRKRSRPAGPNRARQRCAGGPVLSRSVGSRTSTGELRGARRTERRKEPWIGAMAIVERRARSERWERPSEERTAEPASEQKRSDPDRAHPLGPRSADAKQREVASSSLRARARGTQICIPLGPSSLPWPVPLPHTSARLCRLGLELGLLEVPARGGDGVSGARRGEEAGGGRTSCRACGRGGGGRAASTSSRPVHGVAPWGVSDGGRG